MPWSDKRERKVAISYLTCGIIAICLNLALIPIYGATGASVSTLIAEITFLFIQVVSIGNNRRKLNGLQQLWVPIVSSFFAAIPASLASMLDFKSDFVNLSAVLLPFMLVYSSSFFFLNRNDAVFSLGGVLRGRNDDVKRHEKQI